MRQYNFSWFSISITFLIAGLMEYHYHPHQVVLSQTPAIIFSLKCDNMENLIDKKFNRLKVIEYAGLSNSKRHQWKCLCDCGNLTTVASSDLKSGHTKSCGCFLKDFLKTKIKHGHSLNGKRTPEFSAWKNMISRCYCEKDSHYNSYG